MDTEGIMPGEIKPQREREIWHGTTQMLNLKKKKGGRSEQKVEKWLPGARVWGNQGVFGKWLQTFKYKMNKG